MILLVDNYDSFTYNLAQYLGTFTEVEVLRNDDERLYEHAEVADALPRSRLASRCWENGSHDQGLCR